MKRIIIATAALLVGTLVAQAGVSNDLYRDLRPNGHQRSYADLQADVAACQRQTGANRYRRDTPAVKRCMLARGYRWMTTKWIEPEPRPAPRWRTSPSDWSNFLPCCGNDSPPPPQPIETSGNNPACPDSIC